MYSNKDPPWIKEYSYTKWISEPSIRPIKVFKINQDALKCDVLHDSLFDKNVFAFIMIINQNDTNRSPGNLDLR